MRRLVLVGAGHAHARVLLDFARRPVPDVEIVLVSPVALAPYSGMVPGWLAGHYAWEECCIDFVSLCRRAEAALRPNAVVALDPAQRVLLLSDGECIPYDWLSIDIGATLTPPKAERMALLPVRPLSALQMRWDALLDEIRTLPPDTAYRVAVVGGGAAGVESMLAMHRRFTGLAPQVKFQFTLATQGNELLPGMAEGAVRRLAGHLARRGIEVLHGFSADHVDGTHIVGEDGRTIPADAALWATGAQAYRWPRQSGLQVDERGFIRVDAYLQSTSHPNVFAAGDCAGWCKPLPKAGVFAVRMGPVLSRNLRAAIDGAWLKAYRPQRRYLVLIGTGDEHAVAVRGGLSAEGGWAWRWKQAIDRRFLGRYNGE
ncbi:FAD-dependent oxidoreductase [Noviherbaspirillum sp.]|uniref:FAD-dependent oxidoreductase n=1 Tax=Noviherbaspirillum sp. TaxID=1926288 RepID=UPI002FE1B405